MKNTIWHEIKDLVSIYHEYEWDKADVVIFDPETKTEYKLSFCGSSRPTENSNGQINFILVKK